MYDTYEYDPLASSSWTNVSANTTKSATANITVNTGVDIQKSSTAIYVKAIDSAGNIGYSKHNVSVYSSYSIFVLKAYYNALDRIPDIGGFDDWTLYLYKGAFSNNFTDLDSLVDWTVFTSDITGNKKYKAMAGVHFGIFFSTEFQNKNYSNEEYVKRLYRTMLLREPDDSGLSTWVGRLTNGYTRRQVMGSLAGAFETKSRYDDSYGI